MLVPQLVMGSREVIKITFNPGSRIIPPLPLQDFRDDQVVFQELLSPFQQ